MKLMHKKYILILLSFLLVFTGCKPQGPEENVAGVPSISHLRLSQSQIFINGNNLDSILELKINSNNNTAHLKIDSKSKKSLTVSALNPLKLVSNGLLELIVSTADATERIPIYVELPDVSGVKGPSGDKGEKGDRGEAGPSTGRMVLKDSDGNILAHLIGFPGGESTLHAQVVYVMLPSGEIIGVNTATGKFEGPPTALLFESINCEGKIYAESTTTRQGPYLINRVFVMGGKFYKITNFETSNVQYLSKLINQGSSRLETIKPADCSNQSGSAVSEQYHAVPRIVEIDSISDLSHVAPLKFVID